MKASFIHASVLATAVAAVLLAPALASAQSVAAVATTTTGLNVTSVAAKQTGPQFFANLSLGSSGADVMRLQRYLNTHGCLLAQSGPGSYQAETTYFGPLTRAALICFQTDTGLIPATGYLGTLTREYISTLP